MEKYIEHTLLKQDATEQDLINLFEEAKKYNFLGVCINPCYEKLAKECLKNSDVKIVTVVGFPLGANKTDVKVYEQPRGGGSGPEGHHRRTGVQHGADGG